LLLGIVAVENVTVVGASLITRRINGGKDYTHFCWHNRVVCAPMLRINTMLGANNSNG